MDSPDQPCTLLQHTRRLLQVTDQSYLDIYKATGLNPNWLTGIATGRINDPSVNRVQALYEHLKGKALTV